MDFGSLVLARLEELGENVNSFEAKCGWPQGYLRAVVRNDEKRTRPNLERAKEIAEALDLDFYIGPKRETGTVYTTQIDHEDFAAIPRVDARLAAGAGALNGEVSLQGALAFRQDWLRERGISPAQACLLTVAGDSMSPTLHDGDLVMIDERRTTVRNRHVYAFVDVDGSARVKRVELVPDQLIILTSDNAAHPTETRTGPDMNRLRILGEIVWSAHAW
ncbi:helix-turn-helix transcriptional regulator [Roseovarius mucosus]|uniref:Putative HTH-type transcriptional regulator n=1 Tax=Roseovarius mucosus TaxID=215743 RepID=A0A1V0RTB7_9RHOB|nr:LexA family transcriptional regulator [Roseovarius mucosus]ARE84989.1 putative HTH-type transcriptional regulator [Roseovarius mucosus]MBW4975412.1 helix-turn-helix transcriptional regulator [Roseovarius mucosus]